MDQEIRELLEEQAEQYDQMSAEYEERLSEYRTQRENLEALLQEYETDGADPEDAMADLLELQDSVQEELSGGITGESLQEAETGGTEGDGFLPGMLGGLLQRTESIRERAGAALTEELYAQLRENVRMQLTLIDTVSAQIEADLSAVRAGQLRIRTALLLLQSGEEETV